MPLYEYQCNSCGHEDTILEKMSAAKTQKCPSCGKDRSFIRLISAAGFHLKGSGWYQTDFRDNQSSKKTDNPETKAKLAKKSESDTAKDVKTKDKPKSTDKPSN